MSPEPISQVGQRFTVVSIRDCKLFTQRDDAYLLLLLEKLLGEKAKKLIFQLLFHSLVTSPILLLGVERNYEILFEMKCIDRYIVARQQGICFAAALAAQ
ncbi:hypothetical protein DINM_000467 [Dirofilaria immitis]|nr:hypothetical protein [Dirofilaria immitis]